jgi:hypothetical protein
MSASAPTVRTTPTAYDGGALAMRQRWEAHLREKRLDRYADAYVALIAVLTAAGVWLAWLWMQS